MIILLLTFLHTLGNERTEVLRRSKCFLGEIERPVSRV